MTHTRRISRVLFAVTAACLLAMSVPGKPPPAQTGLTSGIDYVPNEVVVVFSASAMPSLSQVSLSTPRFGIPVLDQILAQRSAARMKRMLPGVGSCQSPGGRLL
jgi:hypothetical protein